MKIDTKYNFQDVVYGVSLEKDYRDIICEECKGEGYNIINEVKNFCSNCDGGCAIYTHVGFKFVITPFIIENISITETGIYYSSKNKSSRRNVFYSSKKYKEDCVFDSYEEAQMDIKKFKQTDEWKNKNL